MGFEKRDVMLIAGILFFMIGLMGVGLAPIYALVISITIYFGIKILVAKRKKSIEADTGKEGLCIECGAKIINKKCPNCDNVSKK